jgi:hypothetical protein
VWHAFAVFHFDLRGTPDLLRTRAMDRLLSVASRALALLFIATAAACSQQATNDIVPTDASDEASRADAPIDVGPPCHDDSDCADSRFCNGVERCTPGASNADARGCAPASPPTPCATSETCDEAARVCRGGCVDADGDGHGAASCGGDDCDDSDAQRFPGRPEVCDAADHDEDCNALTFGTQDTDVDGEVAATCCNRAADGTRNCGRDCDDAHANVRPGLPEVCDSLDNDCDGMTDEGAGTPHYVDADHDGFGLATTTPVIECGVLAGYADNDTDCDDADGTIHPGAPDPCDGVDNNCNGTTDDGPLVVPCRADLDGDGVVGSTPVSMASCTCPPGTSNVAGPYDCDDADPVVHPGQTMYFTSPRSGGSFDYDCNGTDDPQYTRTGGVSCSGTGTVCTSTPGGWAGDTVPACGTVAQMQVCTYTMLGGCLPLPSYPTQACR